MLTRILILAAAFYAFCFLVSFLPRKVVEIGVEVLIMAALGFVLIAPLFHPSDSGP